MNKKEAVAYAQITLDFMQSSKYTGKITPDTLGIEMRQAFKLYPRNIVLNIAESQSFAIICNIFYFCIYLILFFV